MTSMDSREFGSQTLELQRPEFESLRELFPALDQEAHGRSLIYLDNAATTQKPRSVIEVIDSYYRKKNANVHRAAHFLSAQATHAFEGARDRVRAFINAGYSEEIIWTRGATEAINLVAQSWGRQFLREGDEILLSVMEHHANIVPWQLVAKETGACIKVIGLTPAGELDLASFRKQLSAKTRLVSIAHISNAIGTVNPVALITREAHAAGVLVMLDGSQAIAHQTIDVQKIGCDFYVFSGHKAFGPTGTGVLYGRKELLESMPPWQAGGEMIRHVSFQETTFNQLPFKFEAGTPHIAGAVGLGAAMSFLQGLDNKSVVVYERQLRNRLEAGLSEIKGVKIIGQAVEKAPVTSFISDKIHNQDLSLMLDQHGIAVRAGHHCAMPLMESLNLKGTVRASLSLYNNEGDVDTFLSAMESIHHGAVYSFFVEKSEAKELPELFAVMPYGRSIEKEAVNHELMSAKSWQERYRHIMLLGKKLPQLPDNWKTESALLHGCESQVWLHHYYDEENQTLHFIADSDARIIRGLITLVLVACNGKTPADISAAYIEQWFLELGLISHLSPSRGNGLKAIIAEIESVARRYY
ncbi:SufS family cysteine desulfurase [Endozoicomonas sp. Mp262]|uniref:SufS family cysteine desulfurase n=1 Tax=Endozoicomonas sp. Mp262 TaxID=2919499 RepID=UPI0021D9C640